MRLFIVSPLNQKTEVGYIVPNIRRQIQLSMHRRLVPYEEFQGIKDFCMGLAEMSQELEQICALLD